MLPNRTLIYPANLLPCRQTQLSIQALAEDIEKTEKTPWLQHVYQQTCAHVCVWQLYSQWRFHPWFFFSWKPPPFIFCLWLHQTWHFKSLGIFVIWFFPFFSLGLVLWVVGFFSFPFILSAVLNLRWMLLSLPSLLPSLHFWAFAAFSLRLALIRQLSLSQVKWWHFYSSSAQFYISGNWFLNYLNVNSIHLIVQIRVSPANPCAFQLTSVSSSFALVINARIYFWSQLLKVRSEILLFVFLGACIFLVLSLDSPSLATQAESQSTVKVWQDGIRFYFNPPFSKQPEHDCYSPQGKPT